MSEFQRLTEKFKISVADFGIMSSLDLGESATLSNGAKAEAWPSRRWDGMDEYWVSIQIQPKGSGPYEYATDFYKYKG